MSTSEQSWASMIKIFNWILYLMQMGRGILKILFEILFALKNQMVSAGIDHLVWSSRGEL